MSAGRATSTLAVLALAALVVLPFLGSRDLWAPDEPRYAQVAVEMLRDGEWWQPHVNGRVYPDKPHLYFWLAALASIPAGHVTEATARLPSALAALALAWLTLDLGRRWIGPSAGTVGALVVATSWLCAWMSRRASLDVLLAACATGAIWALARADLASGRPSAGGWGAVAGACVALGLMTKGPVVLLPVAAAAVAMAVHPALRRRRARGRAGLAAAAAVAACTAVTLAWLAAAASLGGYDPFGVVREHVVERASEGMHHAQPPWYFLGTVPPDMLPWTFLLVPAVVAATRPASRSRPEIVVLLAWAFVPLLALSVIVEKRNIYVLPLVPAWGLLVGAWVEDMERAGDASAGLRRATRCAAVLLAALGVAALVASVLPGSVHEALALEGLRVAVAVTGVVALSGAVAIEAGVRRRARPLTLVWSLAAAHGAAFLAAFALVLPALDPLKSGRPVGAFVAGLGPGAPVGMYPRTWDAYAYYSGRSLADLGDADGVRAWLDQVERPAHVLVASRDLDELPADRGGVPPREVFAADVGHRRILVMRYDLVETAP